MTSEPGSAAMERTDFVKRLRTARANGDPDKYLAMITVWEAHAIADRLETLTRERDEAREALKPWQPIETAPQDGTAILVSDCRVAGGFMNVVTYELDDRGPWVWRTNEHISYHGEAFTHWMPLPAPPEEGRALADGGAQE